MLRMRSFYPQTEVHLALDCSIALSTGLRDVATANVCSPDAALHPALSLALGLTLRQVQQNQRSSRLQEDLRANPLEQVYLALGAAAGASNLTLILLAADQLAPSQWKRLFADTARLDPPVVFAVLPGGRPGIAALADRSGIPGISVDAADPVALYRVAGESFGRALAGGGPALIEALRLDPDANAYALLRRQMIARGAATERWAGSHEGRMQNHAR